MNNEKVYFNENEYCPSFTGSACTDGTCPVALSEEYPEYDIDVPSSCFECSGYKGCENCIWDKTLVCPYYQDNLKKGEI